MGVCCTTFVTNNNFSICKKEVQVTKHGGLVTVSGILYGWSTLK